MVISHKHKFIFIHNYKVAGTSITKSLSPYGIKNPTNSHILNSILGSPLVNNFEVTRRGVDILLNKSPIERIPSHITAQQLSEITSQEKWDTYFKFGFVRNPWDWQVSLYHYALQSPEHHQYNLTNSFNLFSRYIEWRVREDKVLQKSFFYSKTSRKLVDFIGKMENISTDFQKVCAKIGIESHLPHSNKSKRKRNYREYYNEHTKELIEKHFKEDIDQFDYTF